MHIAFLTHTFPKLSETFILNQITGLMDQGHSVTILAQTRGTDDLVHPDVMRYDLLHDLHTFTLNPSIPTRISRASSHLFNTLPHTPLKSLKTLIASLSFPQDLPLFQLFFAAAPFLSGAIPPVDVLLCHFGPFGLLGSYIKRFALPNTRVATVFHGYDMTSYLRTQRTGIYDHLFQHGDIFLPISERWKTRLLELGCPPSKTHVHHMGIDPTRFDFHTRVLPTDPSEPIQLLSIARLEEKKGISYALQALHKTLQDPSTPALHYTIVGDGALRSNIEQLIQDLNLSQHVTLLGWRTQDEVRSLILQSHLLLAPSVTAPSGDQEGIPVVLMESLATGLPVLSTFHSGIPELVQHEVCGLLSPERDADTLAHNLTTLLSNPTLYATLARNGRTIIETEFNIHTLNQDLPKILLKT